MRNDGKRISRTTLGAKSTAHDRFQEWVTDGVFLRLWQTGVEQFDDLGGIHGEWLSRDGAITKAPLGGEKNRANPTDQGKQGVKRHVLTEGHGVPLSIVVDGANRHDLKLTRRTWEGLVIERPEPADAPPQNVCLDQGYDDEVRDLLPAFGFTAHLRTHGEDAQALREEASQKARRWVVERAHSEMNRFRRLLVRWDNKPKNYLAFLHFVCRLIAFPATGLFG